MPDEKLHDVFLSYNSRDKAAVEELARRLEDEANLKPWLDKWNLKAGEPWQEAVEEALAASRACAVLIGPSGISSWQHEEMRAALQARVTRGGFPVIAVLLPDAHRPGLDELPFLSRLTWIDFSGPEGLKDVEALRQLAAGIRGVAPGRYDGALRRALVNDKKETSPSRRRVLLILLTAFFVLASVNLIVDLVWRFVGGIGDGWSIVRIFVLTMLLTLLAVPVILAAGTLTEPGRAWVENFLTRFGLLNKRGVRKLPFISAAIAVLLLAARLSLPFVATYYNDWGMSSLEEPPNYTSAEFYFRRALSLNPAYAEAHYNLGALYEYLPEKENYAIDEYIRAIELDSRVHHSWNNLARRYILRGSSKDLEKALTLIDEALKQLLVTQGAEQSPSNNELIYTLYKNQGWAYLKQGRYPEAEAALLQAIKLRDRGEEDQGAAAHCLLGYVLKAQNKPGAADRWYDCVRYKSGQVDVESDWYRYAQNQLHGDVTR